MNHWLIVPVFVIGFLLLSLYLGIRAGKGRIHTTVDHVVAGRKLGFLLVFFVSVGEIWPVLRLSSLSRRARRYKTRHLQDCRA